jgi:hypothetical protein
MTRTLGLALVREVCTALTALVQCTTPFSAASTTQASMENAADWK